MGERSITELLNLIRDTVAFLKEETPSIYASPEDAAYFRKSNPKPAPLLEIPVQKVEVPPAPAPVFAPPKKQPEPLPLPPVIEVPKKETLVSPPKKEPLELPPSDLSGMKKLFGKIAPDFPILNEIPSDEIARKINTRWKTKNQSAPISILSFQEPPAQKELLSRVAAALDVYYGPARVVNAEPIEKEKQWEAFLSSPQLKLAIICDYSLWQLSGLMHHYKENPAQGTRTLGSISLFLLPDLSLYLKDPLLKRSLWKALCQKLSS